MYVIPNPDSAQVRELLTLFKILVECQNEPVNIFSESQHTVQVTRMLAFSRVKDSLNPIANTMLLIQDILNQRTEPWYLSHIWSHSKLPGVLAKGDIITDGIIMIATVYLLEQAGMLHQQFYLSPQRLYKLLPELPILHCKHLSKSYTTCVLLAPLGPPSEGWGELPRPNTQCYMANK